MNLMVSTFESPSKSNVENDYSDGSPSATPDRIRALNRFLSDRLCVKILQVLQLLHCYLFNPFDDERSSSSR